MTEGFTVDPDLLRGYSQQVQDMIGGIGEAHEAAGIVMNENAYDVGENDVREYVANKLGLHDSGRLDVAYGELCQPAGMLLEDYQQKITDTIGSAIGMLGKLSKGLSGSATTYDDAERRAADVLAASGDGLDDVDVPVVSAGG